MNARRLGLAVVCLAVASGGCDSDIPPGAWRNETPTQAPVDDCDPRLFGAAVADAGVEGPGETYDYVVRRMTPDEGAEPPANRGYHGFDLDARRSPSPTSLQRDPDCSHGDFYSTLDPDQNEGTCVAGMPGGGSACRGGVDNQLPNVLQTLQQFEQTLELPGFYNRQIDAGRYTVLLRVAGVHGTLGPSLNDPSVVIRVYPVAWPAFQDCGGAERPGQDYAVDDASLRERGNLRAPVLEYPGCILRGRLRQRASRATDAVTPMVLPLMDGVGVRLRDLHLRVDLAGDEGTRGNLGGSMLVSDVVDALVATASFRHFRDAATPLTQGFVDLPGPLGSDLSSCESGVGRIGVGVGFTLLRANIAATTVSGPVAGACGSR